MNQFKVNIRQHEGKKYLRTIHSATDPEKSIEVDVYCVLEAFGVKCPAVSHAIKKLLMPGARGKGTVQDDLMGVLAAVNRAVELQRIRECSNNDGPQHGNTAGGTAPINHP